MSTRPLAAFAGAALSTLALTALLTPAAAHGDRPAPSTCGLTTAGSVIASGPLKAEALPDCNEADLYYGLTRAPDPAAALQCGLYQLAHPRPAAGDPFYGAGVLTMLFANGRGVARNVDTAICFARQNEWWDATGRLLSRRAALEAGANFDLCEDASGYLMGGACESLRASQRKAQRNSAMASLQADWSPAMLAAFRKVEAKEQAFSELRGANEVDASGTARLVFWVMDADNLSQQVLINLKEFLGGGPPPATSKDLAEADGKLNELYRKIQAAPGGKSTGTPTADGVKKTQQGWLELREAWVEFMRIARPKVTIERIRTRLTWQRVNQMKNLGQAFQE